MLRKSILLNGASSAGKTSTAKAICELDPSYSHFSDDAFIDIAVSKDRILETELPQIRQAFLRSAAIKIASGHLLVLDTVCLDFSIATQSLGRIPKEKLLLVGLKPSLEALMRREFIRQDRPLGVAMEGSVRVHRGINYNLEIDNSLLSPQQSANMILDALKS